MGQVSDSGSAASIIDEWLARVCATSRLGKMLDVTIVALFFILGGVDDGGGTGWPVLLFLRASAFMPFMLTHWLGIVLTVAVNVDTSVSNWGMLLIFCAIFVAINAVTIMHQLICMGSAFLSSALLLALWRNESVWPIRALFISLAVWAVATLAGSLYAKFRGLSMRVVD